jgi:signal transduction histidine kinase
VSLSSDLVRLAIALADPSARREAAEKLARLFDARELLLFVRDIEAGVLVTAPGMRQRLPGGRSWQRFLSECCGHDTMVGELPIDDVAERIRSVCFKASDDVFMVLVGVEQLNAEIAAFRLLLPLLGVALEREHRAAIADVHVQIAEETTRRAENLAAALDAARRQMADTNAQLRAKAKQLEEANEMLQDQAAELEAQADELESARDEADAANRAKSEFLTTMSHELRTPLNAISGYVQLLQLGIHGPLTDEQRGSLERIEHSQRHLLALINDVLSLARIESGTVYYDFTVVDLRILVKEIAPLVEQQMSAKRLNYQVEMPHTELCVRVDEEKLRQVLLNLISNAIKFTPEGGTITVSVGENPRDHSAYVAVADTGIGIPAEKIETIFDPFVQVHTGFTRSAEGTGLGLSISRDLAEGMGATLTVDSRIGKGSIFTITLPTPKAQPDASSVPIEDIGSAMRDAAESHI